MEKVNKLVLLIILGNTQHIQVFRIKLYLRDQRDFVPSLKQVTVLLEYPKGVIERGTH